MTERLANVLSKMRLRGAQVRQDEVLFTGGVCTEDPYGGRLGPGAFRDCHNVDMADRGARTKRGWVRFGKQAYLDPPEGAVVVYCKYTAYSPVTSFTLPAANTAIANFNGSGQSIYVLDSRQSHGMAGATYEVFFVLTKPQADSSVPSWFTGSTLGTRNGTADPFLTYLGGPYAITELGNDEIDQANEVLGYDSVNLNEDPSPYVEAGYLAKRANISPAATGAQAVIGGFLYKNSIFAVVDMGSYVTIKVCNATDDWVDCNPPAPGFRLVYFDRGVLEFERGTTVTTSTSTNVLKIYRVVILDGTFEGGDARGYFMAALVSGTAVYTFNENFTIGATVYAQVPPSGTVESYITIARSDDQKFRYARFNFSGAADQDSIYFVTGAGYAYELYYDEADSLYIITPIKTLIGIDEIANYRDTDAEDKPKFIAVNRNTLFLGYVGGSIQQSGSGNPFDFRAIVGYDEKGIGEEITNFFPEISGSLLISATNSWWAIYGDSQQNFDLQLITNDSGAYADSGSSLSGLVFIDSPGITTIKQATEFGNWAVNSLTRDIDAKMRWMLKYCTPIKTIAVRDLSIIRFYFEQTVAELTDSSAGTVWVGMKVGPQGVEGFTFGSYNKKIVDVFEGDIQLDSSYPATREVFFLASDGYLYRDEQICVADNEAMTYSIDSSILTARSRGTTKHWHEMFIDCTCQSESSVDVEVTYHDANGFRRSGIARTITPLAAGSYWDTISWDATYWDNTGGNVVRLKLMGLGDAMSVNFSGSKYLKQPDYYKSVRLNFTPTETRRQR